MICKIVSTWFVDSYFNTNIDQSSCLILELAKIVIPI